MPEVDPAPDDADILAAELALGLPTGEDRADALRRSVADPTFAAMVERWRLRFAPLLGGIAPVPAPADAWDGVVRRLPTTAPAALARWRAAAVAASAVAAVLAAILLLTPDPVPPTVPTPMPLLAQVAGRDGQPIVSAQYDAATGRLRVRTANLPAGTRVPELWAIEGDAAPRSLGLFTLNGSTDAVTTIDVRRLLADGVTIAITLEPRDGRPHTAPSGTILGTTTLVRV